MFKLMLSLSVACLLVTPSLGQPVKGLNTLSLPGKNVNFQQQLLQRSQAALSPLGVRVQQIQLAQPLQQQQQQQAVLVAAQPVQAAPANNLFPVRFQGPLNILQQGAPTLRLATKNAQSAVAPQTQTRVETVPAVLLQAIERPKVVQQRIESPINAAVEVIRTQEVIDVPSAVEEITPQIIIVEPNVQPVTIEFRSRSTPVHINQVHIANEQGEERITRTEEKPDRVIHEVLKPVVAEVRELIQPIRLISQKVLPVREEFHSVVTRGQRKQVVKQVITQQQEPEVIQEIEPAPVIVQQQEQQLEQIKLKRAASEPEPVYSKLPSFGNTGTIVRAGLIGGTRIMSNDNESASYVPSINNRGVAKRAA